MRGHLFVFTLVAWLASAAEQDFWSGQSAAGNGGPKPGAHVADVPVATEDGTFGPGRDKIEVSSSFLHVRPKNKAAAGRVRTSREAVQSFRRPRQYQFVTNGLDRLPPPPSVRVYPPVDRSERFYDRDRDFRKSKRRIIYYATLPEIVRPPAHWFDRPGAPSAAAADHHDPRRAAAPSTLSYAAAPPPRYDDEVTRVHSNIIDVTGTRYTDGYRSAPASLPHRFTIIDVEPPYNFPGYRDPPQSYDINPRYNYNADRYYGDIRTPPFQQQLYPDNRRYRPAPSPSHHPVDLSSPATATGAASSASERPSTAAPEASSTATSGANSTLFLPDALPVSLRSLALTRFA